MGSNGVCFLVACSRYLCPPVWMGRYTALRANDSSVKFMLFFLRNPILLNIFLLYNHGADLPLLVARVSQHVQALLVNHAGIIMACACRSVTHAD